MNTRAAPTQWHRTPGETLCPRIIMKVPRLALYQGIKCQYRRCRKMIALKLVRSSKRGKAQSTMRFNPFVVRCPHCMRYQLCKSESVLVFEGPLAGATVHDHPKLV